MKKLAEFARDHAVSGLPRNLAMTGGGCGCTIHTDRDEPCPNSDLICIPCQRECWGLVETIPSVRADLLADALRACLSESTLATIRDIDVAARALTGEYQARLREVVPPALPPADPALLR